MKATTSNSIRHDAEKQKAPFSKESVKNADLYKLLLNKNNDHARIMRTIQFRSSFKACVRYFLRSSYFSPTDSRSTIMKDVLFHLKCSFRSRDIQIFVFSPSPLFSLSAIA